MDPAAVGYGSDYTEGNAWQYSWYVPQDIAGLQKELGGAEKLSTRLDSRFDAKVDPKAFAHVEDISGLIGYYPYGNEPSHHIAYLYGYTGQPWRTQERLKQIMDVSRATVNLPNGKRFTVIADQLDDAHPCVGKVTLNAKPLDRVYIRHEDIEAGGELRFEMQAQPNKDWGQVAGKPAVLDVRLQLLNQGSCSR